MNSQEELYGMMACTLCESENPIRIAIPNDNRIYFKCMNCKLIFVDPHFHLTVAEERERYKHHNNSMEHQGYVAFLNRVIQPALQFLSTTMKGLDYGCGPVPTLSRLLDAKGISCYDYDPLFGFNHPFTQYDFIFATECFEHFFQPGQEIEKINYLLKPGGYLAIMTEVWASEEQFKSWYYTRDPTHVSFFHRNTFDYVCKSFGYSLLYEDQNRVFVLQKSK